MTSDEAAPETSPSASRFNRRALLRTTVATTGVATVGTFWFEGFGNPLRRGWVEASPAPPGKTFDAVEWATLEAALDRVLPSAPGSPGAKDVNAIGYLDAVLREPDFVGEATQDFRAGAARLASRARDLGAGSVRGLPGEMLDALLRECEGDPAGLVLLRRMVYFSLEALLGDPVHGGNTNGIGWQWLGIQVGGPRPTQHGWQPRQR